MRQEPLIVEKGADSLLKHLRGKFPEFVPESAIAPQAMNTQVVKYAAR